MSGLKRCPAGERLLAVLPVQEAEANQEELSDGCTPELVPEQGEMTGTEEPTEIRKMTSCCVCQIPRGSWHGQLQSVSSFVVNQAKGECGSCNYVLAWKQ